MKALALVLLILLAVIFAVAFALEDRLPWLQYVRAAAEGGMVGALADWFAVTALFRHPLGLPIPHTAIIPHRKDEIGANLGDFVEQNFLSEEVVRDKLAGVDIATVAGSWLAQRRNARRVAAEASNALRGAITLLDDDDMRRLLETLARRHLIEPVWAPPLGGLLRRVLASGGHRDAVDLVIDRLENWVVDNPDAFARVASGRLPRWMPSFAGRLVDDTLYREVLRFVREVRDDPDHRVRHALDDYLASLADRLHDDPETIARLEVAKARAFDDPRVRELSVRIWDAVRSAALEALADETGPLRTGIESIVADLGARLATDSALGSKVNSWLTDAAGHFVSAYRHDIAGVITDTVRRWDAAETTQKIELMVGRDLQFIRINGTVVGSLAGLAIFTVATLLLSR
jgi:Predicted membrane protein